MPVRFSTLNLKTPPLFNIFSSPSSLIKSARDTKLFVKNAVDISLKTNNFVELIESLDEISNRMCIVTDSAECIKRLHPERKWRIAAENSFNITCSLMSELNSNQTLSNHFIQLESKPRNILDPETEAVIKSFKKDFNNFNEISEEGKMKLIEYEHSIDKMAIEFERFASGEKQSKSKSLALASLENLIRSRFVLAKAANKCNPLEILLEDKQLSTSDCVFKFLKSRWNELKDESEIFLDRQVFEFTTLNRIIETLCKLTRELFGVEVKILKDLDFAGNLTFKLEVIRNNEQLGTIHFDFGARKFKDKQPVHYTNQCRKHNHKSQPAIILISIWIEDFQRITWQQSQSIFHEFGHALHSVLSETKYQVLSGTRGPVDLAEIPSTLFELIHDSKDVQNELKEIGSKLIIIPGKRFLNEAQFQIQIATLDQLIHKIPPGPNGWTRNLLHQVNKEFPLTSSSDNKKRSEDWHTEIGHFSTYGGTYFAYSFSKTIAEKIWKSIFRMNCFNSQAGAIFQNEFLAKGGTANLNFINDYN